MAQTGVKKTKHPITCSASGKYVYDEFHFSETDMIETVREHIAGRYGLAVGRVKVDPSNRTGMTLCFRVDMLGDAS